MLKTVKISQYKGFYGTQTIEFAVPNNSSFGSGLTLVVGPNNTGKTTVIESLLITESKKFKESERHGKNVPKIVIGNTQGGATTYTNNRGGSLISFSGAHHGINFELIPSRRYWQYKFGGQHNFQQLVSQSIAGETRNSNVFDLGPVLKTILSDSRILERFNSLMKRVIPHFTSWTIDTGDDGSDYVKYKTASTYHQSNLLGDGIISLFRIVAHLIHDQSTTFIIDEPELSLHPAAQKRLAAVLSELSKDRQIIICTHSPYFINWHDFANGAKVIRLNKDAETPCRVYSLDNSKDYSRFISGTINEYQKPQLLDLAAKEILFSDRIFFTEGQEDVGLIKRWMADNDIAQPFEIFGYGVGGEKNMKLFLEMAKDLGIAKVAALYDSNSTNYSSDQSSYPDFLLKKLSTEDIRDKVNRCIRSCPYGKDRNGTFLSNGRIKTTEKSNFQALMNEIVTHLST